LIARPLAAMAVGRALANGSITSIDTPVAGIVGEWTGEARGRITLRQLLEETSGLASGGDIRRLLQSSPWNEPARLPAFATSRGVRLLLGNDFESTALDFPLEHEVGGFHNESPANAQVTAVVIERVSGMPYERFIDEQLWGPLGAGPAQLPLDRRSGMPVAHCCWRAAARDVLRVANLLVSDGRANGHRVLPPGWAAEMARPSKVNAETGMQLARISVGGNAGLSAADDSGSTFWVFPERELVVVNMAGPGGGPLADLPARLLAALRTE
jgi:CubicO group peptidase (beta-lactamase class C family)